MLNKTARETRLLTIGQGQEQSSKDSVFFGFLAVSKIPVRPKTARTI
jgi:hypothetical protein